MENWRDNVELDDDLKTNPTLAKYETPEAALKGLVDANSRLGRSITIPSEEASEEQWAEYRQKLQQTAPNLTLHPEHADEEHAKEFWKLAGVPEKADEYQAPEGFDGLPDDYVANMREVAAAAGWTKKQFEKTLGELSKEYANQQQSFQEAKAADEAIVKKKFGLAKDQRLESIKAFAEQFADPDHPPAWLSDTSMLTAGDILMMDKIIADYTGKGPQAFQQPTGGDVMTPDEIREKQSDIRTRLLNERSTLSRPEYKRLTQKLVKLGEMLVQS